MSTVGGLPSTWPRTLTVLGVGATFLTVPTIFPISELEARFNSANEFANSINPQILWYGGLAILFLCYVIGESHVQGGASFRQRFFANEGFDNTFVLVSMQDSALLFEEYRKVQIVEDMCDGLFFAILSGIFVEILRWKELTSIDWLILGMLFSIGLAQPFQAANALRAFNKKLVLRLKTNHRKDE